MSPEIPTITQEQYKMAMDAAKAYRDETIRKLFTYPEQPKVDILKHTHGLNYASIKVEYSAICSVGRKPFWGTALIEYKPDDMILEFESVDTFVHSLGERHLIIEDVARLVFDELRRVLGDIALRVTVSARTTVHSPVLVKIEEGDW